MPRPRRNPQAPDFMRLDELLKILANQGRTEKTQNKFRRWLADFGVWLTDAYGPEARPTEALAREFMAHMETAKGYTPATMYNVRQALSYWSVLFEPPGWFRDEEKKGRVKEDLTPDLAAFSSWLEANAKADKTVGAYVQRVRQFQKWWSESAETAGQEFDITAWTAGDVPAYVDGLKESAKPATINLALSALSQYGDWAVSAGVIPKNPVENHAQLMVSSEAATTRWLDSTDDARLADDLYGRTQLDYNDAPWKLSMAVRDWTIYLLMRDAGLRVSEVSKLELKNVKLDEQTITVRFSKWNRSRTVPMTGRLKEALAWWLMLRGDFPAPFVFMSQHYSTLADRTIQDRALEWKQWNNLPEWFNAHALRHTFGKSLGDSGIDPARIALLMGHLKKDGKPKLELVAAYVTPSQAEVQQHGANSGR